MSSRKTTASSPRHTEVLKPGGRFGVSDGPREGHAVPLDALGSMEPWVGCDPSALEEGGYREKLAVPAQMAVASCSRSSAHASRQR